MPVPRVGPCNAWLVRDPRSETEQPQIILRIGYGSLIPAGAPRRTVTDVAEWLETAQDKRQDQDHLFTWHRHNVAQRWVRPASPDGVTCWFSTERPGLG